ncbi:mediator of RNA polymerase II transcription subunit 15a-like [Cajanus cajan]|uniref:mediator of RNA polymerase II transcription subunit 15a-like n=1 Tax=Cajanus cajan TaxID=3821 RepID=UPI0010FAE7FA|nr:mediator of RNA polymerase II transcription subunit 15a-like [Cajanus cajan]
MVNQFSNLLPQENQVFVKQQGDENVVQQQINGEITSPIINTCGILASPLLEKCNEVKENCQDEPIISDDSSTAMQHMIKVLNSISTEAVVAFCEDIRMVLHLNDNKSMLEPLTGPPIGVIGSKLEGVIVTDSQARYLTRCDFDSREWKMNRFINSMPSRDSIVLPNVGKPFSNSVAQEHYTLLEEIQEINRQLIDTEVVVDKEKTFQGVTEEDIKHGEGLTVKLSFNSVSVNLDPMSNHASTKVKYFIF